MYINTLKLQQISLITKFIDTYNSSNSRYLVRANASICKYYVLLFNIVSAYPTHKRAINPHLTDSRDNL